MRILHLVLAPRHSGAEIVVGHLARQQIANGSVLGIASLDPCDPPFASILDGWRKEGAALFVPESDTGSLRLRPLRRVQRLRRAFREFRPDVVFAHSVIPSAYARLATPSARVVTVLHSATQDDYDGGPFARAERLLPSPRAVVGVTARGLENYRRRFSPSFPLETIPNGIDLKAIQRALEADQTARRRELLGDEPGPLLLQVGRISVVKRQEPTIRALATLREGGVPAVLALPGIVEDEPYQASLEARVREHGLGRAVRFLGARSDVPDLLAAADAVLMPSEFEAHSLVLLEALASERPVVASDIQAFEFAKGQPAYWAVDPEDTRAYAGAIANALEAGNAQRDVEAFSVERMAAHYDDLARRLVAG